PGAELQRAGHMLIVFPDPACRSRLDPEPTACQIADRTAVAFELQQSRRGSPVFHPWYRPAVEPRHTPSLIQRHAVGSPLARVIKMVRESPVVESRKLHWPRSPGRYTLLVPTPTPCVVASMKRTLAVLAVFGVLGSRAAHSQSAPS